MNPTLSLPDHFADTGLSTAGSAVEQPSISTAGLGGGETVLSGSYSRSQSFTGDVVVSAGTQINASYPAAIQILSSGCTVTVEGGDLNCNSIRNSVILFGDDAHWENQYGAGEHLDGTVTFTGSTATLSSKVAHCITAAGIVGDNVTVNFSGQADGSSGIRFQSANGSGPGNEYGGVMAGDSLTINGTFGGSIVAQCDFSTLSSKRWAECRGLGTSTGSVTINGGISGTILASSYTGEGYSSYAYGIRSGSDKSLTVSRNISGTIIALTVDGKYAYGVYGGAVQLSVSGTIWAGQCTAGQTEAQILSVVADTQANKQRLKDSSSNSRAIYAYQKNSSVAILAGAEIYGQIYLVQQGALSVSSSAEVTGFVRCGALTFVLEGQAASSPILGDDLNAGSISIDAAKAVNGRYILVDNMSASSINLLRTITVSNQRESVTWQKGGSSAVSFSTGEIFQFNTTGNQLVLTVSGIQNQPDIELDVTPPTLNGTPFAQVNQSNVTISWNPATDNVGVAGYWFRYGTTANLTGDGAMVNGTSYSLRGLSAGTYYYQVQAYDAAGNASDWSTVQTFTIQKPTTVHLPYEVPQAEYMYGCTATVVGMLLGYYDRFGYLGYRVSNLIDGTVELDARGQDGNMWNMNAFDSVLGSAIASEEYVARFFNTSPSAEYPHTFVDGTTKLNTAEWNCIADYLGTGQYWRGNVDLSTSMYYSSLNEIRQWNTQLTISGEGRTLKLPIQYFDVLYGLDLYVEQAGYRLDAANTATIKTDNNGGTFTFEDYQREIDSGRAVILHIEGHSMLGYGYDTKTNEIIFDDTYNHDRRMTWGGSYYYSSRDRELEAVTTVAFDISRLTAISAAEADFDGNGWSDTLLVHDAGYCGAWMTTGESDVIEWRDLSMVNSGWSVFGTGHVYGSKRDEADIFVTDGKILGAWTMENGAITGWQGIETFDPSSADVLGLGDFNADGASDVLMRSKSATGDLGFYLTNGTGWQYLIGLGPEWEVAGVGDLDGNGYDDVIIRHDAGYCGAYLISSAGKKAEWLNLDMLDSSMELIGCGDVNGDGREDIFLRKGEWVGTWIIGKTGVTGSWGLTMMDTSSEVEQLGDFNLDGITDLRVRTAGGDVGALYVNGAESVTWQYFQGLGSEWTTKYSAQIC